MTKIFFVLLLAPWVYAIGLAMYFIILLTQKKKLPILLVVVNFILVGAFLYLHNLVYEQQFTFTGSYARPVELSDTDTDADNANTFLLNLGIGVAIFFVVQFLYMKYINKRIDKLNDPLPVQYHKRGGIL
jgi:hypothetical protein